MAAEKVPTGIPLVVGSGAVALAGLQALIILYGFDQFCEVQEGRGDFIARILFATRPALLLAVSIVPALLFGLVLAEVAWDRRLMGDEATFFWPAIAGVFGIASALGGALAFSYLAYFSAFCGA